MAIRLVFLMCFLNSIFLVGQINKEGKVTDIALARILFEEAETLKKKWKLNDAIVKAEEASKLFINLDSSNTLERANCLKLLGEIYFYQRNYDAVSLAWDTCLAIRIEKLGSHHSEVGIMYYNIGYLNYTRGKTKESITPYNKALDIFYKSDKELKEYKAKTHNNIAISYKLLSNESFALEHFNKALEYFILKYGKHHHNVISVENNIAVLLLSQTEYDKAIYLFSESIMKNLEKRNEPNEELANLYINLGNAYFGKGDFTKAEINFTKAENIRISILKDSHPKVAECYVNLGVLYKDIGDFEKSILYFNKALFLFINEYGSESLQIAETYDNMGDVYSKRKTFAMAIEYYNKALDILLKQFDKSNSRIAKIYHDLGVLYSEKENYRKAILYFDKALEIQLHDLGEHHSDLGLTYNSIGNVYGKLNDFEKAYYYHFISLEINQKHFSELHTSTAKSYINLGTTYFKEGNLTNAVIYYEKALTALNFLPEKSTRDIISNQLTINSLVFLSFIHYQRYKYDKDIIDLYKCKHRLDQAIELNNFHLDKTIGYHRNSSILETFNLYDSAISCYIKLFEKTDSLNYLERVFDFSERAKSHKLYSALQDAKAISYANIPSSLLEKEHDLRTNITFYYKKRRQKIQSRLSEMDTTVLKISSQLFDLNRKYENLKQNFEENYPDYYRLKYDLSTIKVKEVQQKLLNSNQSLLEYFVGDSSIFIYLINQDDCEVHEIKKDFPLEEWVKTFRKANDEDHFESTISAYCQVAHELYQKLIAPIATDLKKELIIIPGGILGYIPFEALLVEPVTVNEQRLKDHHYLLLDKQISYSYSATLLKQMREKKHKEKTPNDFLAFAPYYDGDTILLAELFRYGDEQDRKPFKPLPNSGAEVYGIQKITGGNVYYKEDATEGFFISLAGNYRIIHLATHGRANDKVGDYCYLAFTEQKDSIENELLYVRDLYNLQLNADMVVLSACETGIGELQKGEGIISLARGMTYAGAKSIITSLWSVEDGRTKDIMISFYKNLKKGMTKDAALRQAKLDFVNNENNDHPNVHPFYWSGFIGIGDMSELY